MTSLLCLLQMLVTDSIDTFTFIIWYHIRCDLSFVETLNGIASLVRNHYRSLLSQQSGQLQSKILFV